MTEIIDISLTPAEVVAIVKAQDRWPMGERYPEGFLDVQIKISNYLDANPAARAAVKAIEGSAP
jgi:hypothetical protein